MDAGPLSTIGVALAGAPVAFGLVNASSRLEPIARVIDVRHPAIVAGAIAWATVVPSALTLISGPQWLLPAALFTWGGLAIALSDLASLRAPHLLSLALGMAGVASAVFFSEGAALASAITAAGCFVFMHAARLAFRKARGFDGMGGGDPLVMAALGAWSGPVAAPWVLACACVLGLAAALAVPKLRSARARLAFGPLLIAGATTVALISAVLTQAPFWGLGSGL